jgi:tRNA1(Val) A37 N6-methylase TrmN6
MLEIAQVSSDDVLFDLGCGDGRILIAAVKDFGAKKAVGYEMRRDLYKKDLEAIKSENLEGRIKVFNFRGDHCHPLPNHVRQQQTKAQTIGGGFDGDENRQPRLRISGMVIH